MANQVNTLDINAREWFDRVNGNSYFSAQIVVDFGLDTEKSFFIPFSYGYGDFYLWEALRILKEAKVLNENISALYQLQDAGTIIRYNKQKALKRELKQENY